MFNTKSFFDTLQIIKGTSSRNEKIKLLTDYVSTLDPSSRETLVKICVLVFDYNITFNIAKIPKFELENSLDPLNIEHHLSFTIPLLQNRSVTGNHAKDMLKYSLSCSENAETAALLQMIINKSFDVGADLSTFSLALNEEIISEHQVMLCSPGKPKVLAKLKFPLYGQLKYDAMRIEHTITHIKPLELTTRPGKKIYPNNDYLNNESKKLLSKAQSIYQKYGYDIADNKIFLDGEMIFLDADGKHLPREESNGVANSCLKNTKDSIHQDEVVFYIWDIITQEEKQGKLKIPYSIRLAIYTELLEGNSIYKCAETSILATLQEAKDLAIKLILEGQEGIILKEPTGVWSGDRVAHQVKMKAAKECELLVTGYNIAEDNKYAGMIGSLICQSKDNLVQVSVSGLKDKQRKEWIDNSIIGNIITVRFNMLIKGRNSDVYSLFLPRFVELRLDKLEADTLQQIQDSEFVIVA